MSKTYKTKVGVDFDFIMVTSPTTIKFEIMICQFALDILGWAEQELVRRSTLEEDESLLT